GQLDVEGVRAEGYRDTAGPGREGVRRLFEALAARADPKGKRDRALLSLLYHLGLRRAEAFGLDLADVDLQEGAVAVLGKGRREKVSLTLPGPTRQALAAWVAVRGPRPGPLFVALDPGARGERLGGSGLYRVVRRLGEAAGVRARPHGLRHSAITGALDLGCDLRDVQRCRSPTTPSS